MKAINYADLTAKLLAKYDAVLTRNHALENRKADYGCSTAYLWDTRDPLVKVSVTASSGHVVTQLAVASVERPKTFMRVGDRTGHELLGRLSKSSASTDFKQDLMAYSDELISLVSTFA